MIQKFNAPTGRFAKEAFDLLNKKPVKGIPIWMINPMEHANIDRLANMPAGSYKKDPVPVYIKMEQNAGCTMVDQFIPENPLSMGDKGYEADAETRNSATAGNKEIEMDGMKIDSPEAVVENMEKFWFPGILDEIKNFNEEEIIDGIITEENKVQKLVGEDMLKVPYGYARMPFLGYFSYGYENYFMAYALYPEVMERSFKLQTDYAVLHNKAIARAITEGGLPPFYRMDHDMADQKGMLIDIKSLDKIWFPYFKKCMEPLVKAGVTVIWHCDGNLMDMLPRLIECGLKGFQGFQYEFGMDYEKICAMKT